MHKHEIKCDTMKFVDMLYYKFNTVV